MFKLKNMINFLILDISHYMNNYLINPQVQIGVFLTILKLAAHPTAHNF
jgi:hypothetical protein